MTHFPFFLLLCVVAWVSLWLCYKIDSGRNKQDIATKVSNSKSSCNTPKRSYEVGTGIPAKKALPVARARTPRSRLHKLPWPVYNPSLNSLYAPVFTAPFSTASPAAVVAASLLMSSTYGSPHCPHVYSNTSTKAWPLGSMFSYRTPFAASYTAAAPPVAQAACA